MFAAEARGVALASSRRRARVGGGRAGAVVVAARGSAPQRPPAAGRAGDGYAASASGQWRAPGPEVAFAPGEEDLWGPESYRSAPPPPEPPLGRPPPPPPPPPGGLAGAWQGLPGFAQVALVVGGLVLYGWATRDLKTPARERIVLMQGQPHLEKRDDGTALITDRYGHYTYYGTLDKNQRRFAIYDGSLFLEQLDKNDSVTSRMFLGDLDEKMRAPGYLKKLDLHTSIPKEMKDKVNKMNEKDFKKTFMPPMEKELRDETRLKTDILKSVDPEKHGEITKVPGKQMQNEMRRELAENMKPAKQ